MRFFVKKSKIIWELFIYFRKKYSRNFRDYGLWVSCKKSIAYLLRPVYQKTTYYLYELSLDDYVNPTIQISKYVFRNIDPTETFMIHQIEEMEEWLKGSLKAKLETNCLCMAVLDGERVVGINYVSIGEGNIPLLKLKVLTGPEKAWLLHNSISREYRRQGLSSQLRTHCNRELKARGIQRLYSAIQESNVASRQMAKKFSARVLVRAEYKRFLWMHRLKCGKYLTNMPYTMETFHLKPLTHPGNIKAHKALLTSAAPLFLARIEELR